MAQIQSLSIEESPSDYNLWDRLCILKDRLIADARFQNRVAKIPFLKNIAKKRANQLFDVMAGFVYTQILLSCVRLNLFNLLKDGPLSLDEIKRVCALDVTPLKKLLDAAVSIELLEIRSKNRYGLGTLGAPMVGNTALSSMIEHHTVLYDDLRDPLRLLSGDIEIKKMEKFCPYVSPDQQDQ